MADRLKGKVAIVTGAGTGIGEAIAHKFAAEGARLLLAGLPDDPIEAVAGDIRARGGEALAYGGDLAEEEHAHGCVSAAVGHFGRLDVLAQNAAVFLTVAAVDRFPLVAYDRMVRANQRLPFLVTRAALPHLRRARGNIVYAGSDAGIDGVSGNAAYAGTKGWVHAFAKSVALEEARHGVRANVVALGPTDTAWTRADRGPMTEAMERMLLVATPLGRRANPEEIANVYAFLASDEASFVTAAVWSADGGITAAKGPAGADVPDALREPPRRTLPTRHAFDGYANKTYETFA